MLRFFRRPPPPADAPPIEEAHEALRLAKERRQAADRRARDRRRSIDPVVSDIISNLRAKGSNA